MLQLYHLSFGSGVWGVRPKVPKSRLEGENSKTPRISVAKSLDDCLTGIGLHRPFLQAFEDSLENDPCGREIQLPFTVRTYRVPDDFPGYVDNTYLRDEVPDAELSGECWITERIEPDDIRQLWLVDARIERIPFWGYQDIPMQYLLVRDSLWSDEPRAISRQLDKKLVRISAWMLKSGNA